MSALPVDTIVVEIEARLQQLRSEMNEANRIIAQSTEQMAKTTAQRGPGAIITGQLRGLGTAVVGVQGVRGALEGASGAVHLMRGETEAARESFLSMANTVSFGLAGAVQGFIDVLTQADVKIDRINRGIANSFRRQAELTDVIERQRALEFEIAGVTAITPQQRAAVGLAARRREISAEQIRLEREGTDPTQIGRVIGLETRLAEAQAVRSAFGAVAPESIDRLVIVLESIERNTRDQGPL